MKPNKRFSDGLYKSHINKIHKVNRQFGTYRLISLMQRLLSKKIEYIFMLVPVSERLYEGMNLIYEELIKQKIPYHYFVSVYLCGAMVFFEKLFFEVGIRDFYRLTTIYHRITNFIPTKSEEILNGEPILTFSDVQLMMRIALQYKLSIVDIYKIIDMTKFKITDINERVSLTEPDIHKLYKTYLEKKNK